MRLRIFKTLSFIFFYAIPIISYAATYQYYFSNDDMSNPIGSDANGNGSISNPWQSLSKAQLTINSLKSTDTVYLYFGRGSTWTCDTESLTKSNTSCFDVVSTDPTVHIDAYGSGDMPIFDGLVTNFGDVDEHLANNTWPVGWSRFFFFDSNDNCSVKNVEIKGVYGHGIALKDSHYFTLTDSTIHDFGGAGFAAIKSGLHDTVIRNNTVYSGQLLYKNEKGASWGGGIQLGVETATGEVYDNLVQYNTIYDIYGECIWGAGATIEYNIVGSCGSGAIYAVPHDQDMHDTIVRYNYITYEDYSETTYDSHPLGRQTCFAVVDEAQGGNNNSASLEIYGNICINYPQGFNITCEDKDGGGRPQCDADAKIGSVSIYDNLIIDPSKNGVWVNLVDGPITDDFSFYNNSIQIYDHKPRQIIDDRAYGIPADWESNITGNHYWLEGGTPSIDSNWDTNSDTSNPRLLGEPATTWSGQSGAEYYKDITPILSLNPPSYSRIYNLNPLVTMSLNDIISSPTIEVSTPKQFRIIN